MLDYKLHFDIQTQTLLHCSIGGNLRRKFYGLPILDFQGESWLRLGFIRGIKPNLRTSYDRLGSLQRRKEYIKNGNGGIYLWHRGRSPHHHGPLKTKATDNNLWLFIFSRISILPSLLKFYNLP